MADHADDDELLAGAAGARGASHPDDDALIAAAGDAAVAPAQRSFLAEAAHRAADFGRGVAENTRNIPSTSWKRIKENAKTLGHPFVEAGREVADELTHPMRTLQGAPLARALGYSTPEAVAHHDAVNREAIRGIQSNVPLAGLAHERLTDFLEADAADAAEAPHAAGAGQVAGMAGLALAPKAVPLVGRTLARAANAAQDATMATAKAARSIGEGAIARSAARGPVPTENVAGAVKETIAHSVKAGHMRGPAALERAATVGADEAVAALARRLIKAPEHEAGPFDNDLWTPRRTEPLPASWRPRPGKGLPADELPAAAASIEPTAPPVASEAPRGAVAAPDDPIAMAREALRDPAVTPAQADALKKAIAGYEEKAARVGPKSAPRAAAADAQGAGGDKVGRFDAEERAHIAKVASNPDYKSFPLGPNASRDQLQSWLQRVDPNGSFTDDLARAEDAEPMTHEEAWQAVRDMVADDMKPPPSRGPGPLPPEAAPPAELTPQSPLPARPEMWGGRPPNNVDAPRGPFVPSARDEKFARKLGKTVEQYRDFMARTDPMRADAPPAAPGPMMWRNGKLQPVSEARDAYTSAVKRLAKLALESANPDEFARHAASGGLSEAAARKIWESAHRGGAEASP